MEESVISNATNEELASQMTEEFRNSVLPVTTWFGLEIVSGIIGNLLTIYVFLLHYKPCNFRFFVLSLALTDLISCVTTIPAEMVSQLFWYTYPVPAVCKIKVFFNQYTVCSEAASLAIIAIDRHRKVCRPFGWQIKQKTSFYACVVIHIVSALLAIPTPIFWGVHSKQLSYKGRNVTVTLCEKDQKYLDTPYPLIIAAVNGGKVLVSLLVMLVPYILVARKLICSRNISANETVNAGNTTATDVNNIDVSSDGTTRRASEPIETPLSSIPDTPSCTRRDSSTPGCTQKMHRPGQRTTFVRVRRKTMIGFYLTLIFIVTMVLYRTLISVVATGILDRLDGPRKAVYFFFMRLYFINHVINPILYGVLDRQFRKVMARLKAGICSKLLLLKSGA